MKPIIDINNPLLWVALGGATLIGSAAIVYTNQQAKMKDLKLFGEVLNPMIIRDDKGGSGWFGSGRVGHVHQGTDFVCRPGQSVYAPFAGRIIRSAKPYPGDDRWNGLVMLSDQDNYECKLFYCTLAEDIGEHVERGQLIAFAQAISGKYSSGVTDHVHIEVRQKGIILNPENLWRWSPAA